MMSNRGLLNNELHSDSRQWHSNIWYYPLIRHQQQQQRQKAEITISRLAQYLLAEILPEK